MEVGGQLHAPDALPPGTHWIGDSVGPRLGLNTVTKRKIPNSCRESSPDHSARSLVVIYNSVLYLMLG